MLIRVCATHHATYVAQRIEDLIIGPPVASAWNADGSLNFELSDDDQEPHVTVERLSPGVRKVAALLDAVSRNGTWLAVELEYFDLDYRSEFSATHETAFGVRRANCSRLHFFAVGGETFHEGVTLREALIQLATAYRGYAVVRPQVPGTIGRSLLSPTMSATSAEEATMNVWLPSGEDLQERVRTAVTEPVELLGVPMLVSGVPFMEQDGYLLTCAHVSAWICHYSAVLRGLVPRRPTAAFHLADKTTVTYGRRYPSTGLALGVLGGTLRSMDLPAEILETETLLDGRRLEWHDRPELAAAFAKHLPDHGDTSSADGLDADGVLTFSRIWLAENLVATICRYVNSGIPVILAEAFREHTRVICGYVRQADNLKLGGDESGLARLLPEAGVGALIFQDDQASPYTVESVADIVDRAVRTEESTLPALLVPLPTGIWMSGATAENLGAAIFGYFVDERHDELAGWAERRKQDLDVYRGHVDELVEALRRGSGKFSLRTYVSSGSAFKAGLGSRDGISDALVESIAYTHLPKFVWVVELIERDTRRARTDSKYVVGTVLLDASIVEDVAEPERWASPLAVHVAGAVASIRRPLDRLDWQPTGVAPYSSGRWHGEDVDATLNTGRMSWKGAVYRTPGDY